MAKKEPLSQEEVTELFSEIDASGVLDPARTKDRSSRLSKIHSLREAGDNEEVERLAGIDRASRRKNVDPLSADDPSGSQVGQAISKTAMAIIIGVLVLIVGMQVGYGVIRRLNTANLSDNVSEETVTTALEGGLEWGNGFTQFPHEFSVDMADERAGVLEVTVLDTDSSDELELLSNGQIQAAALATNALLNDKINRVVYNVDALVDDDDNIQHDTLFGMIAAQGERRAILTFVWTKSTDNANNIDWQLRIVSMDDKITSRIEKQVNSVSSIIEDPSVAQNKLEDEADELELDELLQGEEVFKGGEVKKSLQDVLKDDK